MKQKQTVVSAGSGGSGTRIVQVSRETRRAAMASPSILRLLRLRTTDMSMEHFIEHHGSGTLRKNTRIGMVTKSHYLEERVAYVFGYGFVCLPRSYVTYGDAYSEPDCHPITEAGWHAERMMMVSPFPEDKFQVKYIMIEHQNGDREEGVGIIVRQTCASFIPSGHIVFAIVAHFDKKKKKFRKAKNPF